MRALARLTGFLKYRYKNLRGLTVHPRNRVNGVPHNLISLTPEAAGRLRELVEQSGLTPERVGRSAGCPALVVEELMDGRRVCVHPDVLRDISRVLQTYPAAILDGSLDPAADLGNRIARLRRDRGLSQKRLAELMEGLDGVGIHPGHIRRLERGQVRRPREENLVTLARALGVSPVYLLHGTADPPARSEGTQGGDRRPGTSGRSRVNRRVAIPVAAIVLVAAFLVTKIAIAPNHKPVDVASMEVRLGNARRTIEAVEGPAKHTRWFKTYESAVEGYEIASWNGEQVLLVGLDYSSPTQAGGFLVYRLSDGHPLVSDVQHLRERAANTGLLGTRLGEAAFVWTRYPVPGARLFADVDGDHADELLIASHNIANGAPSRLRVYETDGSVMGTFCIKGQLNHHLAGDFDGDGRDEIILNCASNQPDQHGFSLLLLDAEHLTGVSPDALGDPDCKIQSTALRAVTFSAFADEYMRLLGSEHLTAWETQFLRPDTPDGATFLVSIGADPNVVLLLYLDANLNPLSIASSDVFRRSIVSAPGTRVDYFLNHYLPEWLERAAYFPARTMATSSFEYNDVPQH